MGNGVDRVSGDAGVDTFIFTAATQSNGSRSPTRSTISCRPRTSSRSRVLQTGTFAYSTTAGYSNAGANSEAWFDNASRMLHVDIDGDNVDDMIIILTGVNRESLSANDFIWT